MEETAMHCPNCGTAAVQQQKFCRACGFSLEQVAQLLAESGLAITASNRLSEVDERASLVEKWRAIAFYVFAASAGTGLLAFFGYGIIYKMMIVSGNVIPGLLLLLFFLGAFSLVILQAYAENLRKNQTRGTAESTGWITGPNAETLSAAVTTSKLLVEARRAPPADIPISVTEDTTKDLHPHP